MLPTWIDLQPCSAQERMFCSMKGRGIISCRVTNREQHETGVGEGRSWVITAGQPSQILIKIANKLFAHDDGVRMGREPARLTPAQVLFVATLNFRLLISPVGLQFPTWETGTTTLPYQGCRETCPGRYMAHGEGSATPGWTTFSQQPPQIKHRSWASPTHLSQTQLQHQVSNPSSKSSVTTLLICKSTFLTEIQPDPPKQGEIHFPWPQGLQGTLKTLKNTTRSSQARKRNLLIMMTAINLQHYCAALHHTFVLS